MIERGQISCARLGCFNVFAPDRSSQRYCSRRCLNRRRNAEPLDERACKTCSRLFRPRTVQGLYCSPRCQVSAAQKAYERRRRLPLPEKSEPERTGVPRTVSLDADVFAELEFQAERLDRSVSWIVSRCLDIAMPSIYELPTLPQPEIWRRSR